MTIKSIFRGILIGVPFGYLFINEVGYIARVEGVSMQPVLNPDLQHDDYVFLSHWALRNKSVERGDVIIFKSPKYPNQKLIKRVIGLPGDIIHTISYRTEYLKLPHNQCWVEGDHTGHSMDSNSFGPIPCDIITAKATCIIWPPSRWQCLESCLPSNRFPINSISAAA